MRASGTSLVATTDPLGPHSGEIPTARSQSVIFPISIHRSSERRIGSLASVASHMASNRALGPNGRPAIKLLPPGKAISGDCTVSANRSSWRFHTSVLSRGRRSGKPAIQNPFRRNETSNWPSRGVPASPRTRALLASHNRSCSCFVAMVIPSVVSHGHDTRETLSGYKVMVGNSPVFIRISR